MHQPPVTFQKFVAIDWSGAERPINTPSIQVAEYVPANGNVGLVPPPNEEGWSRADVADYVQQTVNDVNAGPVLIGFDFAFGYPYCGQGTYFPGVNAVTQPQTPRALWATVEQWCNKIKGDNNFYGAPFFRKENAPYREFFHFKGFTGNQFMRRSRVTDDAAAGPACQRPNSVFNCIGGADVGTGSVAGMRVLHELLARVQDGRMGPASIWPFDINGAPAQSTIVEIYPTLFLHRAEIAGNNREANNLPALCRHFGAALQNLPPEPNKHQRDALVSAAGMAWFIQQGLIEWQVPACAAQYEGWIFGTPVPVPAT